MVGDYNMTQSRDIPNGHDLKLQEPLFCRNACSIDLGDSVVITGGYYTKRKVTQYNGVRFLKEMPQLIQGRRHHGCSYYTENDKYIVKIITTYYII